VRSKPTLKPKPTVKPKPIDSVLMLRSARDDVSRDIDFGGGLEVGGTLFGWVDAAHGRVVVAEVARNTHVEPYSKHETEIDVERARQIDRPGRRWLGDLHSHEVYDEEFRASQGDLETWSRLARRVAVQAARVRRQADDRAETVLADDRAFVVSHPQHLRQALVAAHKPRGRVKQAACLAVGRGRQQDLRPAVAVDQPPQRIGGQHRGLAVLPCDDKHHAAPLGAQCLAPEPLLCHGSSVSGFPSQRSSDWVSVAQKAVK